MKEKGNTLTRTLTGCEYLGERVCVCVKDMRQWAIETQGCAHSQILVSGPEDGGYARDLFVIRCAKDVRRNLWC